MSTIYVGNIRGAIRDITITDSSPSSGTAIFSVAVEMVNTTASMSITDTTMTATNTPTGNAVALTLGTTTLPHLDNINTYTAGAQQNDGVEIGFGAKAVIRNSWIYISGAGHSVTGNPGSRLVTSTVNGATSAMAGRCDLVLDVANNPYVRT